MRTLLCLTTALLVGGSLPVIASAQTLAPAEATKIVDQALQAYGTFKVLHTAPGPGDLTAALVRSGKKEAIVWIVGHGDAVLLGRAVGREGEDLSHQAAVAMGVLPKALAPADVAAQVQKHQTFLVGDKGPEIIAFMDPNCIWCHKLYMDAKPLIASGKLKLRVVLVGIIKPSSFGKAATILAAKDPAVALATDENHFDESNESGGVSAEKDVPPALTKAIHANGKLLEQTGEASTPTLLFQDKSGAWKLLRGLPEGGIAVVMADIQGTAAAAPTKGGASTATAGVSQPATK